MPMMPNTGSTVPSTVRNSFTGELYPEIGGS